MNNNNNFRFELIELIETDSQRPAGQEAERSVAADGGTPVENGAEEAVETRGSGAAALAFQGTRVPAPGSAPGAAGGPAPTQTAGQSRGQLGAFVLPVLEGARPSQFDLERQDQGGAARVSRQSAAHLRSGSRTFWSIKNYKKKKKSNITYSK